MFSLLGKRLLGSLPQLVAVTFLTYLLVDLAPGNYCDKLLERPTVSEADIRACQAYYGYDQPFLVRYARWLGRALTGDFGMSFEYHRPVFALIVERLGNTLFLAVTALVLSWTLALSLGVASARRPYSWIDKACGLLAYTGLSLPPLLLSILALVLAFKTGWFPIGDTVSSWHSQAGFLGRAGDRLWHVLLPALVIAFTSMAGYMRQMRSSMLETLTQDFVRTARAKGLDERVVVYRHAFVNAVNPLVTLFG